MRIPSSSSILSFIPRIGISLGENHTLMPRDVKKSSKLIHFRLFQPFVGDEGLLEEVFPE